MQCASEQKQKKEKGKKKNRRKNGVDSRNRVRYEVIYASKAHNLGEKKTHER